MEISIGDLKETIKRAFTAGWEQGQAFMVEDAELRDSRIPVGPKGMIACRDDYVGDEMYDIEEAGDE
jgi:hypothetical protein